jgi:flagellin
MSLVIQTNVASLQAQKNVSASQGMLAKSFNRLSSGFRINPAADDAAGMAISESMKSQIRSYSVAERNANDGISMAQTAEGALGEISNVLGRMRELSVQGANGSLQSTDRTYLQTEFQSLQHEITRITSSTKFNNIALITSTDSQVTFQVGIGTGPADQISVSFGNVTLGGVVDSSAVLLSGSDGTNALAAITQIDTALTSVSNARAKFGAAQNRLEVTTSNIQTARLNLSASNSRIRDVDVASEAAEMSRNQVLAQAGASMLAQANQSPQLAMGLLR